MTEIRAAGMEEQELFASGGGRGEGLNHPIARAIVAAAGTSEIQVEDLRRSPVTAFMRWWINTLCMPEMIC